MGMYGATYSKEFTVDEEIASDVGDMIIDMIYKGLVFDITSDGEGHAEILISGPLKKLEPLVAEYFGSDQVDLIGDVIL